MERWLVIELGAAIGGTALLATLGWLMQRRRLSGVVLVGMAAAPGAGLCILTTFIGRLLAGNLGGWIGLIAGMALSAVLFPPRLAKFVKAHSAWPFVAAWLTICALCVVGYLLGDWPGLAMVPFATSVIMLWLRVDRH